MKIDGVEYLGVRDKQVNFIKTNFVGGLIKENHNVIAIIIGLKNLGSLVLTDRAVQEVFRKNLNKSIWSQPELVMDIRTEIPLDEIRKVKRGKTITQGLMIMTGSVGSANVFTIETESQGYSWEFNVTSWHRTSAEVNRDIDLFGRMITERIPKIDQKSHGSADEIRKLAELKNEGIITEKEFEMKKKQLLGV